MKDMFVRIIVLIPIFFWFSCGLIFGHDNKIIHPFVITGRATNLLLMNTGGKIVNGIPDYSSSIYYDLINYFYDHNLPAAYHTGSGNFDLNKITKKGSLGSIEEDDGVRPVNHFFNPYNPPDYKPWWGSIASNAMEWGRPIWTEAVNNYADGNKELAYENLGRVIHLMEDMSSPPHVHGDFHVLGSGNYEAWCLPNKDITDPETQSRLAYFESLYNTGNPQIQPISSYDSTFMDLAKYTYDAVKIQGKLNRDKNNPVEGDLKQMFPSGGVAYLEYVDPDLLDWNGYWKIAGVGTYEKVTAFNNDWWEINNSGYFYIENCRYAIPSRYFNTVRGIDIDNTTAKQSLCYYWAGYPENLIVKTDEYTAGLLKYFYDFANTLPPYVKKISVLQDGNPCYNAYWQRDEGQMERTLTPTDQKERNLETVNGPAKVTVEFTKKVKDVVVKLETLPLAGALDTDGKIWTGDLTFAEINGLGSGDKYLMIEAKDQNGQLLDANPQTVAKSTSSYFTSYEDEAGKDNHVGGKDKVHHFLISTIPLAITYQPPLSVPANDALAVTCALRQTTNSEIKQAAIYYRNPQKGGVYTEASMTTDNIDVGGYKIYSATIPSLGITDQGLEYFLYAKDAAKNVATEPQRVAELVGDNPTWYSGPDARKMLVHWVSDGGVLVQGTTVELKIYLPDDQETVDVEFYLTSKEWDKSILGYDSQLTGIKGGPGTVSRVWGEGYKIPGNYFYLLKDSHGKIGEGRLVVLQPSYEIKLTNVPSSGYDNIYVDVSGANVSGAVVYQNNLYHSYLSTTKEGEQYVVKNIPASGSNQYFAGAYNSYNKKDYLQGYSGYLPNTLAPIIIPTIIASPQTWNHSIKVSCNVQPGVRAKKEGRTIKGVELNYTDAGKDYFKFKAMQRESGDTYMTEIPAQTVAGTVRYYFTAADDGNNRAALPVSPSKENSFSFTVIEDNTPPAVAITYPNNNEESLPLDLTVNVVFSESIQPNTLSEYTIHVADAKKKTIPVFSINYDDDNYTLSFKLKGLMSLTTYTCQLGSNESRVVDILDLSGNRLNGYSWSFTTKEVLPPAITNLTNNLNNFNVNINSLSISFKVSREVKEVKIIFKNTSSQKEYTFSENTTMPKDAFFTDSYSLNWDGKIDGGQELPAGEYLYRIEATDAKLGITGSSELQPFTCKVRGTGTVGYEHKITYINCSTKKDPVHGRPNFGQTIKVEYDYERDWAQNKFIIHLGDRENELGTDWDSEYGASRTEYHLVNANSDLYLNGGNVFTEVAKFYFQRRYIEADSLVFHWQEQKSGVQYNYSDCFLEEQTLTRNDLIRTSSFTIILCPNKEDILWTDKPSKEQSLLDWPGAEGDIIELLKTIWVNIENAHIIEAVTGQDYDDNPEVETKVDWWVYDPNPNKVIIKGYLSAKNVSPPVQPFIFDRSAPGIEMVGKKFGFSSRLKQECDLTFTVTDNLPYPLNRVSLNIYDAKGVLVKTLYEQTTDGQATHPLVWLGEGSADYNNGELVKDGKYLVKTIAIDKVGNEAQSAQEIILDNTPPEVSVPTLTIIPQIPPNPPLPKGEEILVFTGQDAQLKIDYTLTDSFSKVIDVLIRFEGAANFIRQGKYDLTVGGEQAIRPYLWDGKDDQGNFAPDGDYLITIEASDELGNKAVAVSPQFKIDRTPAYLNSVYLDNLIFTPDDGSANTGDGYQDTVTLHYVLSERANVELYLEDTLGRKLLTVPTFTNQISGSWLWDGKVDGKYASDGAYKFRIKTIDAYGNTAYGVAAVIKNQVPAEIIFPAMKNPPNPPLPKGEETYTKITGIVNIKGIALDPGISNPNDFKWYKLYYREGGGLDFNLNENNPLF